MPASAPADPVDQYITTIGGASDVERFVEGLDGPPSSKLHLDFTGIRPDGLVDPRWGAVLSNVLSTVAKNRKVDVDLPQAEAAQAKLARAGLLFALARHPRLDSSHLQPFELEALDRWRWDWAPVDVMQPLFDYSPQPVPEHPSTLRSRMVAFLNPNEVPRDYARTEKAPIVHSWLRELIGRSEFADKRRLTEMLRDISVITDELLDNVRSHARVGPSDQCVVSLFATRGQTTRLYVSVTDTGRGIPNSLAGRDAGRQAGSASQLRLALDGGMDPYARDRGRGLARIREIVERREGRLFIASGPDTAGEGCLMVDVDFAASSNEVRPIAASIPVNGTVVMASFKLESRLRGDADAPAIDFAGSE